MKYQIPEDTLPGAHPSRIAPYITILVTGLLAGPWIGFGWAAVNGHMLGCRDMARQWFYLVLGAISVTATAVAARWMRLTHERVEYGYLFGEILNSVSILILILVFTYVAMRQAVLHRLHMRGRKSLWGIPTAVALIALSLLLRGGLVPDQPLLRQVIGGMSLGII